MRPGGLVVVVALGALGVAGLQKGPQPNAFAALPVTKKRVAVVGAGGEAGAVCFGLLQRVAQSFASGLAPPRALIGAKAGSKALNGVLGSKFILAYAGEDLVKLTDFSSVAGCREHLRDCDAVVIPTRLEDGPGGDLRFGALSLCGRTEALDRLLEASSDLRHVVVVAPASDEALARVALAAKVPSTTGATLIVVPDGDLRATTDWNFNKGTLEPLAVVDARKALDNKGGEETSAPFVEDLADCIRNVLVLLDATKQRTLYVSSAAPSTGGCGTSVRPLRLLD